MTLDLSKTLTEAFREQIETCVKEIGGTALVRFRAQDFVTETKGAQDFVSEVDRETELALIDALGTLVPKAGFLGEEFGGSAKGLSWVIDPIDGTSNFVRGIPLWCLSVALVLDGRPLAGVIYDPNAQEMYSAVLGLGTLLNGVPVSVAQTSQIDQALLGVSFSFRSETQTHVDVLQKLMTARGLYRFLGSGALGLAYCSVGRVDGFWEDWMMPWDVAAGLILVTEAGGTVSDFGSNNGWVDGNHIIVAAPGVAQAFAELTNIAFGASHRAAYRKL